MVTPRTSSSGRPASTSVTARSRSATAAAAGSIPVVSKSVFDAGVAPLLIRLTFPGSFVFLFETSLRAHDYQNNECREDKPLLFGRLPQFPRACALLNCP